MSTLVKSETEAPLSYLGRLWILLALTMILVPEWKASGNYERTAPFDLIQILGVYIAPIEALILLSAISFMPNMIKLLFTKCLVRHPIISALVVFDFGMGIVTGYARMGTTVGLAEIKALFLLGIFVYLSRKAMAQGVFSRALPLLCWACILHSVLDFYRYFAEGAIDSDLGDKTAVGGMSCALLPVFIASLIQGKNNVRFPYYLCIAVVSIDIYLSRSRSLFAVALGGVLLASVFCKLRETRPRIRMTRFLLIAGLILPLALVVVTGVLFSRSDFLRSYMFWESQTDDAHNISNISHYYDIQRGIMLVSESPVSGLGFGGNLPVFGTATFDVIHNEFLQFWVVLGIGGAILWLYLFAVLPVQFVRRLDSVRQNGFQIRDEHYLIFSFIGAAIVHVIAQPPFYTSLPQVWVIGVYFASITSVKAAKDLPVASSLQGRMQHFAPSAEA